MRTAAACPEARALGIFPGMTLAKARVLVRTSGLDPAQVRAAHFEPIDDVACAVRDALDRWTARARLLAGRAVSGRL